MLKVHPAFKTGEIKRSANPYQDYETSEQKAMAYMAAHPDLARKAGAYAVGAARDNPQLVNEFATGASAARSTNAV